MRGLKAADPYPPVDLTRTLIPTLGLIPAPPELDYPQTRFLTREALPTEYSPFWDNDCLKFFPARDQGACGACYAFAISTMLSLRYCLSAHKAGEVFERGVPMFSVQSLVSCGSTKRSELCAEGRTDNPYTNACDGAMIPLAIDFVVRDAPPLSPHASGRLQRAPMPLPWPAPTAEAICCPDAFRPRR